MPVFSRGYRQSLSALYRLQVLGTKLGLSNTRALFRLLGKPQEGMDFFHIAGTNGKGSVAVFLQALLGLFEERVGLYTSPHLEDFRERIRIGNELIAPEEVSSRFSRLEPLLGQVESRAGCTHPTYFEAVTALACDYFHDRGVKTVVWETGMGGRLDATNVVRPRLSIITNVSIEHTAYLGRDAVSIAREKAGIIKSGVPLVTAETDPSVLKTLEGVCRRRGSRLIRAGEYCQGFFRGLVPGGQKMDLQTPIRFCSGLVLPLIGPHQVTNLETAWTAAAVAYPALEDIPVSRIRRALAKVRWPCRFEVRDDLRLILDGAHNPSGADVLARTLDLFLPGEKPIMIIGVLKDKDAEGICRRLLSRADILVAVTPPGERGLPARALASLCRRISPGTRVEEAGAVEKALEKLLPRTGKLPRNWICVAGSLRLVGRARSWLNKKWPCRD